MQCRTVAIVTALLLVASLCAAGEPHAQQRRERPARPLAAPLGAGGIVFFGAHPDDELLAAPLLGEACATLRLPCTLLIATRGEKGACHRSDGCLPSLADVRFEELRASAQLLRMNLVAGSLPDGPAGDPQGVLEQWSRTAGGRQALINAAADEIVRSGADVLITFAPSHGSTGHPDHRAVAQLALEAVETLAGSKPRVFFIETLVELDSGGSGVVLRASDAATVWFDANLPLIWSSTARWSVLLRVAEIHRSQFPTQLVAALAAQPHHARFVWLSEAPAAD